MFTEWLIAYNYYLKGDYTTVWGIMMNKAVFNTKILQIGSEIWRCSIIYNRAVR